MGRQVFTVLHDASRPAQRAAPTLAEIKKSLNLGYAIALHNAKSLGEVPPERKLVVLRRPLR